MAVMQNSIIFGGIDSADFGIYIGGEGTFDAPKRDVEMISIPGRNGAFALDKGRFQNIEVTYSAFNHEPDLATFSAQLEGFRNAICSQKGYQRLTDTFHPDEYRMAAYIDGLEIKPIEYNTAATFDIKFNCKPQRYLTSGEEAIDVDSGDFITNPTLFEASPMLEVEGYGTIVMGGQDITIQNIEVGKVILHSPAASAGVTLNVSLLNTGDTIYGNSSTQPEVALTMKLSNTSSTLTAGIRSAGVTNGTGYVSKTNRYTSVVHVSPFTGDRISFTNGTDETITTTVPLQLEVNTTVTNCTLTLTTTYNASTDQITMSASRSGFPSGMTFSTYYQHPAYYGDSTKTLLPSPMYIDLDLGEAYGEVSGEMASFNNLVSMPAELPKLKVGDTGIAYDNTITDLKVIPRWWRI